MPASLDAVTGPEAVRAAFDAWLSKVALGDLLRFGRRNEARLGVKAAGYRLSEAKHRWGSLGRDGVVRAHGRLVEAPAAAIEYMGAHELAHLLHRHHGPAFWQRSARAPPNWHERKTMLERCEGQRRGE